MSTLLKAVPAVVTQHNIAARLDAQVLARPFQRAVAFHQGRDKRGHIAWTHLSFAEVGALTDAYAHGLTRLGVQRGDRVSLLVKPSLEFMPMVFAIFKVGALPVLIDPGMGREGFLRCFERIKPRVLIGEAIAHVLKKVFRSAFKSVEVSVTTSDWSFGLGATPANELEDFASGPFETVVTGSEEEAAILFTSGSTGPAKGVTYTHGIFNAQTGFIGDMYGIEPGEVDLACFPLFGLFSMALGMTVVIPDMDPTKPAEANPETLIETIQSQGCTSAFGSPSIWKGVARYCLANDMSLPSLRRILMAGAPVPIPLHRAFTQILTDGAQIHTPYGATESLPVASIGSTEVLSVAEKSLSGGGICVGRPAQEMRLRIIGISDDPIESWSDELVVPQGEIGEIVVQGPVVTSEYKGLPDETKGAKIDEGGTIVHRMGDVGYLDEQGRLWFCGRKRHRVLLDDGSTRFTVPAEMIFNEHADVFRSALVGVNGHPALVVELEPGCGRKQADIANELRELGSAHDLTRDIERFFFHPGFPVDVRHNAKIHRDQLAVWAAAQGGSR